MKKWISWIDLIEMIEETQSVSVKQSYISECSDDPGLRLALYYSLIKQPEFGISISDLTKGICVATERGPDFYNIFDCLEYLSTVSKPSDAAKQNIRFFLSTVSGNNKSVYVKLLSQTLNLGINAKQVNEIIPNIIPERMPPEKEQRRLICRGQTRDGKWIEGYFFKALEGNDYKAYILPLNKALNEAVEVISETVGEYTNYYDIRNTAIFEGNILEVSGFSSLAVVVYDNCLKDYVCKFRDDGIRLLQEIYDKSKILGSVFVAAF